MNFSKEQTYNILSDTDTKNVLLAADIGGTNSRFGVFYRQAEKQQLALELHLRSAEITDFAQTVVQLLAYIKNNYQLMPKQACFAAAGAVSLDGTRIKLTNAAMAIDVHEIKKKTHLETVYLLNDFQAIAYGIPMLEQQDIVLIRTGKTNSVNTHIIVGAGTGLGKTIVYKDEQCNQLHVLPSEGGHADFAVHSSFDYEFMRYQQQLSEEYQCIISWEQVLAGRGIVALYRFLLATRDYPENEIRKQLAEECSPETIFAHRTDDPACADVYSTYGQWYGRCIKNFALEALAYGGVFIAGGIAAHNSALFSEPFFMGELTGCALQARLIADIPIKVILNTNVGLYGAANYFKQKNSPTT